MQRAKISQTAFCNQNAWSIVRREIKYVAQVTNSLLTAARQSNVILFRSYPYSNVKFMFRISGSSRHHYQ